MTLGLSPSETAFVENLIDLGDASAAAATCGVQPSLALDPRIQSAIIEHLRQHGALDAAFARKTLRDLASRAENEGVRFRAASLLWERGLGKVPDTIHVDISIQHVSRAALYAEIRNLIDEVGLPPAIEGDFEEADGLPEAGAPQAKQIGADPVPRSGTPPEQIAAPAAHSGADEPLPVVGEGASPSAGPSQPSASPGRPPSGGLAYVPELPTKWR